VGVAGIGGWTMLFTLEISIFILNHYCKRSSIKRLFPKSQEKNLVRVYNPHQLLTSSCGGQMRE